MADKKIAIVNTAKNPHPMCAVRVPADAEPGDAVRFRKVAIIDKCLGTVGRLESYGVISLVLPSGGNEEAVAEALTEGRNLPEAEGHWKKKAEA